MSRKLHRASALALVASVFSTLVSSEGAGAQVQAAAMPPQTIEAVDLNAADISFISQPVVQALEGDAGKGASSEAASLAQLVSDMPEDTALSDEMRCLAGAIYFEARGEPLAGQLAVGRVIVNRAASGRYPETYCGVVYQRSQFSFVRGGRMPAIKTDSAAWRNAKAVARIAHEDLWDSQVEGATSFHATHVKPRWRLTRVAQLGSHVFYR
jgi:spore germination cell wall hydrolase CwlJ-like protein